MPTLTPLTLTPSTVHITYASGLVLDTSIESPLVTGHWCRFPAPWAPTSLDPGILVSVQNTSTNGGVVAPILVDAFQDPVDNVTRYSIFAELSSVMAGQTVTELVQGIPVTQMYLMLYVLSFEAADQAAGFFVNAQAWQQ